MKKLVLVLILITAFIFPLRGEIAVNIGGLFSGAFKIDDFIYPTSWEEPDGNVTFSESNSSAFSGKGSFGFNAGIAFFFNYHMGIGVNISSIESKFDINNAFIWDFTHWDGRTGQDTKSWTNEGSIKSIPISINIIYRLVSRDKIKANIFFGPTIYIATLDLNGNGGYADYLLPPGNIYYIDWYDIPLTLTGSHTILGGNGGFEVEYLFSENMAVYFGATYYYAGKIEENWKVKTGQYTGEFGLLVRTIKNEDLLQGYLPSINLSTFTFGAGIKVYL